MDVGTFHDQFKAALGRHHQCRGRLRGPLGLALQVRMTTLRSRRQRATSPGMPAPSNVGCAVGATAKPQLASNGSSATGASSADDRGLKLPHLLRQPDRHFESPTRARDLDQKLAASRQPARRPRPAAGRRSLARHSVEYADHARAGGPAPPPSADRRPGPQRCSRYGMFAQTVTTAHPSTGVHPFAGHPWRTAVAQKAVTPHIHVGRAATCCGSKDWLEINDARRFPCLASRDTPRCSVGGSRAGLSQAAIAGRLLSGLDRSRPRGVAAHHHGAVLAGHLVSSGADRAVRGLSGADLAPPAFSSAAAPDRRFGDWRRAAPARLARSGRAAAALVRLARSGPRAGSSWSCAVAGSGWS